MRYVFLFVFAALAWGCDDSTTSSPTPTVDITSPTAGEFINTTRVKVEGTATNTDSVSVNGTVADVVAGEWEAIVSVAQGEVTVVATAGKATDEVTFVVDSVGPTITLTSPERGFYATEPTITLAGSVSEVGTGIESVSFGGQPITLDAQGNFSVEVPLAQGYNEFEVSVRDRANNEESAIRAGIYGTTVDPIVPIEDAFQLFVRAEALDVVEAAATAIATPEFVTTYVKEAFMNQYVSIDTINFDPLLISITPRAGKLFVELNATNVAIAGTFTVDPDTYPTTINVAKLGVSVEVDASPDANGGLQLQFGTATLDLLEEDITFTIADLSQDDITFLRGLIVDVAQAAFANFLSERLFEELLDPAVLNRKIELLGRTLTFQVSFKTIDILPDGILVDLNVTMPEEKFPAVRDVPGAYAPNVGNPNGPKSTNDLLFTSTANALDRILHGVWRSGLLNQELTGNDFNGVELPVSLTSDALGLVLDPAISSLAPTGTPAFVRLRPLLPPVMQFGPEPGQLGMRLGEFLIDVELRPNGQPEIPVATFAFFLNLGIGIDVDGVEIKLSFTTDLKADLDAEPSADLNDKQAEALFESIVALVPSLLSDALVVKGEADITWVKLESPEIEVHGLEPLDHVTLSVGMSPNPDGI
ncbi:MAG: hypothetical protein R3E66_14500 [bacterium]